MAQIIKHRRGSLENLSGATKRAGELLVVTGSSGISASNGDSILFFGVNGSTVTPANKVLQGTTVPNLSGASYDTSIDGIPFYDTSAEKLFLLNKGGNVEIKATANTGGTGIVSGSSQVAALLPTGTVSSSAQIDISLTTGFSDFTDAAAADLLIVTTDIEALEASTANLNSFSSSQLTQNSTLATYTASVDSRLDQLSVDSGSQATRLTALESFSSSLGDGFATDSELAAVSTSFDTTIKALDTDDIAEGSNLYFTDVRVKTKLDAETVISGSSQVTISQTTGFTDFSSSLTTKDTELFATASDHEGRIDAIEEAIGNGSDIDTRLSSLETFSGSAEADLTELFATASDHEGRVDILEASQSAFDSAIALDGQNVTINGNFTVTGTQTVVNSTTVAIGDNIIELNGSGAANGGLYVKDATAPNTATGSLIWDTTNDQWKAGVKDSEIKILLAGGDSVVSGSSQITIGSTTGFGDFSASLKASDDAQVARLSALETDSGSQAGRLTNLESTSGSHAGRLTGLESFSSSLSNNFETRGQGIASSSVQIVSYLSGSNVNLGGISGSTLNITGTAKIDGNLVLGGNITIGDASSDTIFFGGDVSSDIIPSADNSFDLGSASDRFAEVHATNIYGAINATNGVVSGSSQITIGSTTGFSDFSASLKASDDAQVDRLNQLSVDSGSQAVRLTGLESFSSSLNNNFETRGQGIVSSSAQVVTLLSDQATDFGTGRVSADSIGNVDGSSTITGSFVGNGAGLTGLVTTLQLTGSNGSTATVDLLTQGLSFTSASNQGLGITANGQTITFSNENASTSAKGVASFDADDFSVSSGNVSIKEDGVRAVNLNSDVAGTGIALNGVDSSIEVEYGSTAGSAVEGNTSLTVQGTANEIEISGGSITLGTGGTVTIGLPDDVTIQTGSIAGNLQVGKDLTVVGNLFVQGTTTTIDSTTIQLGDSVLELNYGGGGTVNAGLLVTDITAPNTVSGSLLWNGTSDFWMGGALGSEKEFARFNSVPTSGSVQVIGASGLLVDAPITADGVDVSITGDLTIGGLSANSFLVADSTKTLTSVTAVNAGDLIQWNGSAFVASNTIDGGVF